MCLYYSSPHLIQRKARTNDYGLCQSSIGELSYSRYLHSGLQPKSQPLSKMPQQNYPRSLYQPEREGMARSW